MRVLSYSVFDDVGGTGYFMADAFNALRPDWRYEAVRGAPSYLAYPEHTTWQWGNILDAWANADVVHLHDGFHNIPVSRRGLVVTYHGTGFREQPDSLLRAQALHRAVGLVSTLDLWLLRPDDVTWNPIGVDIDHLATYRKPHTGPLRIGHAPTNRALKSTEALIAAVEKVQTYADVELVLIERQPWAECLRLKGTCDVYFDQTAYGYGTNTIECWAMGIPAIVGAQDATLEEYHRRFGVLPFVLADPGTIVEAIDKLLDPTTRALYSDLGRRHVRLFHSQRALVDRLVPIYEAAAA